MSGEPPQWFTDSLSLNAAPRLVWAEVRAHRWAAFSDEELDSLGYLLVVDGGQLGERLADEIEREITKRRET